MNDRLQLATLAVGNTRARIGLFQGEELLGAQSFASTDTAGIVEWLASQQRRAAHCPLLVASVHPDASEKILASCQDLAWLTPHLRIGRDVPIPITANVRHPDKVGQDRLLCAMAAWASTEGPCVIVDVGTATTVDYIDAEGVFQGGAIAPGIRMMLDALARGTAALPQLTFDAERIDAEPIGKDTEHAMTIGVAEATRGLVSRLVERYAGVIGAYPRVVATGGDAGAIFASDPIVEHIVPDLQLIGMRLAFEALMHEHDSDHAEAEG
ncbi:MAG: type III pantothenate kinase [Phycisphaeraceae bacterium]|nr:type III pantothenate kinase [Phycisphaeraceae bacterium]